MPWRRAVWHEMRLRWLHEVAPGESIVARVKSISLGGDLAKMPNVFALPPFVRFSLIYYAYNTHIHMYIWFFLHSLCQLINFSYFPLCPLPQAMPNYVIKSVFNNYAFPGTTQQTVETSAHARFMWMALLYRYRDTYAYMYITAIKFTAMRRSYPFSNSLLLFQVVLVEFITRSHTKQLLIALRAVNKLNTIYLQSIDLSISIACRYKY